MDPRSIALCALLACAPQGGIALDGGGPATQLSLSANALSVVRGESTLVVVIISNALETPGSATIGFGPLPNGVSATSAEWHDDSKVSLVVSASADAAQGTVPVALQATANGIIVGSTTVMLSVSNLDGSLDPKFGNAGVMPLPLVFDAELAGLAALPDGGWMIGAYASATSIVLMRITSNGSLDTSFGTGGAVTTKTASFTSESTMAVSGDGRFAFDIDNTIMTFDFAGAPIATQTFVGASGEFLTFDGAGFFALTADTVTHIDGSGVTMSTLGFAPSAMRAVSPGTLLLSGTDGSALRVEKVVFDGQSITPDSTFAVGGIYTSVDASSSLTLDIDPTGRPILALSSQDGIALQAFSTSGVLDPSFSGSIVLPSAGPEAVSVIAPGASIFVGGWDLPSVDHQLVLTRFDAAGNVTTTFGTYGVTTSTFGDAVPTAFAINQAGNRICAIGTSALSSFARFMACYRIVP